MTEKELMSLVNRYTEACDDLGCGLFDQTAEETATKHATAAALYERLQGEVRRLHTDRERQRLALNKIAERTGSDDPCRHLVQIAREALSQGPLVPPAAATSLSAASSIKVESDR